jgi:hypothetical protein
MTRRAGKLGTVPVNRATTQFAPGRTIGINAELKFRASVSVHEHDAASGIAVRSRPIM